MKPPRPCANQDQMKTRWWCGGAFVVLCIALGGCASAPARADSAASSQSAPAPSAPPVAAPSAHQRADRVPRRLSCVPEPRRFSRDSQSQVRRRQFSRARRLRALLSCARAARPGRSERLGGNARSSRQDVSAKRDDRSRRGDAGGQSAEARPQCRSLGGRVAADCAGTGRVDRAGRSTDRSALADRARQIRSRPMRS